MYTIGHGRVDIVFDSLEEFHEKAHLDYSISNKSLAESHLTGAYYNGGRRWFGVNDPTTIKDLVLNGWPEMLDKLRAMWPADHRDVEIAAATAPMRKRKRMRGDHGDTLDMHRVWSGNLDTAWERPVRVPRLTMSQKHASIFIDMSTSAVIPSSDMLWRAAAAIKITDLLQQAGRAVEIYVGVRGMAPADGSRAFGAIRVKRYDQPLNPERLAAMVTAGFYRTTLFALYCCSPKRVVASLGPILRQGMPHMLEERQAAGELVVCLSSCFSKEEAQKEFENTVKQLKETAKEAA